MYTRALLALLVALVVALISERHGARRGARLLTRWLRVLGTLSAVGAVVTRPLQLGDTNTLLLLGAILHIGAYLIDRVGSPWHDNGVITRPEEADLPEEDPRRLPVPEPTTPLAPPQPAPVAARTRSAH
ncbi:MAG: hypothetical protein MUE41_00595 [Gemmatimonadaceae bacterium]|jgi:hypothetical protein|nr:hypothetical protein [Gemmatimonadaceae bacterium]